MINVLVRVIKLIRDLFHLILKVYSCAERRRKFSVLNLCKNWFICSSDWDEDLSVSNQFFSLSVLYSDRIVDSVAWTVQCLVYGDIYLKGVWWLLDHYDFSFRLSPVHYHISVNIIVADIGDISRWEKFNKELRHFVKVYSQHAAICHCYIRLKANSIISHGLIEI